MQEEETHHPQWSNLSNNKLVDPSPSASWTAITRYCESHDVVLGPSARLAIMYSITQGKPETHQSKTLKQLTSDNHTSVDLSIPTHPYHTEQDKRDLNCCSPYRPHTVLRWTAIQQHLASRLNLGCNPAFTHHWLTCTALSSTTPTLQTSTDMQTKVTRLRSFDTPF